MCLFVSGYKTLVLDGFSAERLLLATPLIDRSSNQSEPSGAQMGRGATKGEESQKGWRTPQVFGLGLVSASTFIQDHIAEETAASC